MIKIVQLVMMTVICLVLAQDKTVEKEFKPIKVKWDEYTKNDKGEY